MRIAFAVFRGIWVSACVVVLGITLYSYIGVIDSDAEVFMLGAMLVLCFPSCLLYALSFALIEAACETIFGKFIPNTLALIILNWLGFFMAGYVQWFIVLPWLVKKWRKRVVAKKLKIPKESKVPALK